MNQPKRRLKINMIDLEAAFEHYDELAEMAHFLDLETGEVAMTRGEERRLLEEIYEEYADLETGEVDWPIILSELGIPDWQKDFLMVADRVEAGFGTRYIRVPPGRILRRLQ